MKTFGLIGYPLVHSFSKEYFTRKFQADKLDAQYVNFEISSIGSFIDIITGTANLCGLNVTIPYKEKIIPYLDELDEGAAAIGAVNVIKIIPRQGEKPLLRGYNSDIIGFTTSLQPLLRPSDRKALILGTGGASKAIHKGLSNLGIASTFVSRTPRPGMLAYSDLDANIMLTHTLIVNCTPLGTYPQTDTCPDIPYHHITSDHLLFDLVYNPATTLFLEKGQAQGARISNGLRMLIGQAEAAWDIWNM